MPRERSRSPATKRRRTPIRGFGSDTRPRDIKRRRRSPAAVRSDQRSKPSVKHEVLSRAPNKGVSSNRKPLERLGFIRFPGAAPRNTRPPVRRSSQPTKKTDVRRPSSSNPKDARKTQSSTSRRKESSGTSVSRADQKPKDTYFRDDNRTGNRGFKAPGMPAQDHFPRAVSPPILRPLPGKESYSDYRSAAYKQDIDERQRMEEDPNFSSRGQRGHSLDRYRISSPARDPHLFPDSGMLRQGSPYQENNRDMERDNYSSRPGKISAGDGYRHEGGRSFKFDDAAKITVDIRRKVREPSPGMHNMIDTGDIVIVRRTDEGCRPIFDREEIGVGLKHMDESADYTERRVVAMLKQDRRSRSHSPDRMGFPHSSLHENFEVQRDKFESSTIASDPNASMIKPTLSDRWQQFEERPRKLEGDRLDGHQIDNRGADYQMMHVTTHERYRRESYERSQGNFPQDQRPFIELSSQQSPPRDRFQRYSDKEPGPSGRQDRFERIQRNPNDLRHNLSRKRHGSLDTDLRPFDARLRILERKDGQKDTERRTADTTSDSRRRGGDRRPSSSSRSRKVKDDRLPDFSSRPEKYKYQEWQDKPEMIPKGAGYFEVTKHKDDRPSRIHTSYTKHDNRGESNFWTDRRGSWVPRSSFRSRGRSSFRSRGFSRGSFRGGRGMGISYLRRGGHRDGGSPRQWKHDMFDRSSNDKPDVELRP